MTFQPRTVRGMSDSGLDVVLLISRWLHIAAAIVALGGAFFSRVALMRAAAETLSAEAHEQLREAVRRRWAPLVHASIAILLVTGGYNFVVMALPPKILRLMTRSWTKIKSGK